MGTPITNAFSKKVENHAHSVALFAMYYNFVRIHKTRRRQVLPIKSAVCSRFVNFKIDSAPLEDVFGAAFAGGRGIMRRLKGIGAIETLTVSMSLGQSLAHNPEDFDRFPTRRPRKFRSGAIWGGTIL